MRSTSSSTSAWHDRRVIDQASEFGARAARRLRDEIVIWMTTVNPDGSPLPRPIWFIWDGGESAVMYSRPSPRVRNIESNPRVTLHFDGDREGDDIVVFSGTAAVEPEQPPAHEAPDYLEKYRARIDRLGMTPEQFAEAYSVPVRIRFNRLDGY
jgi:PPOX class probable F420-dependent enzyme